MSNGYDPTQYIKRFQEMDSLGSIFKSEVVSISDEECIVEYEASPNHYNPNGVLHGGALYSVMDSSQGAYVHFWLDRETYKFAATGTATIKYLAPIFKGKVKIRTWLKEQKDRKIYVNSEAFDDSGKKVATLEEIWIATLKNPPNHN